MYDLDFAFFQAHSVNVYDYRDSLSVLTQIKDSIVSKTTKTLQELQEFQKLIQNSLALADLVADRSKVSFIKIVDEIVRNVSSESNLNQNIFNLCVKL